MSEFCDYLHELFDGFGPIRTRRMFGGHGVFHDGLMFGLVADNELYLKADAEAAPEFARRGLEPFIYYKKGKPVRLSYYAAPGEIFDDRDEAARWARLAFAAARRANRTDNKQPATRRRKP